LQISLPDGINHLTIQVFGTELGKTSKKVILKKQARNSYVIKTPNKNISIPLETPGSL